MAEASGVYGQPETCPAPDANNGANSHLPTSRGQPAGADALEEPLRKGKHEIFNTDQGNQFTSEAFTMLSEQHGVRISMNGKGSYNDNLFIDRL